ncbi:MAG: hypothetical protein JWM11_476, partial [Planctomycetaceae bacterium]|nr:hypothetical protein [Planctomycetaceae bacterium]
RHYHDQGRKFRAGAGVGYGSALHLRPIPESGARDSVGGDSRHSVLPLIRFAAIAADNHQTPSRRRLGVFLRTLTDRFVPNWRGIEFVPNWRVISVEVVLRIPSALSSTLAIFPNKLIE